MTEAPHDDDTLFPIKSDSYKYIEHKTIHKLFLDIQFWNLFLYMHLIKINFGYQFFSFVLQLQLGVLIKWWGDANNDSFPSGVVQSGNIVFELRTKSVQLYFLSWFKVSQHFFVSWTEVKDQDQEKV